MGNLCSSAQKEQTAQTAKKEDEAQGAELTKKTEENKTGDESAQATSASTTPLSEEDLDFMETLKLNTLLIIHRLVTALGFEEEGFAELAAKLKKSNYLDLCAPAGFRQVLDQYLDLSTNPPVTPKSKQDSTSFEQEQFLALISASMDAPFKEPKPSAQAFCDSIKKVVKQTQKSLRDSAIQAESSDLKIHLFFFAKALDVAVEADPSDATALYAKIESITET